MGETENCCSRNTPDSCLFPIRGSGLHTERNGSLRAAECFKRVLLHTQPGTLKYRHTQWLLNVAAMTLGEYPEGVPVAYRLPASATESDEPFPRFMNIASQRGLNAFNSAGGAIADDFTGDGLLDLLVSEMDFRGELRCYVNQGKGTCSERSKEAGLAGLCGGLNCIQADYNNDGHLDVLILRGGWMEDKGECPNSLLRNNGQGVFQDVTFEAGLGEPFHPTQTATWFDFDNDGDLDLYVGNETSKKHTAPCQLFRNNGDETFTDIAQSANVTNDAYTKSVVSGDYDQDGFPDLYVSNLDHTNRLYHNNGNGTFTDVATELKVQYPEDSFPAWFWDYDNDGRLDIFVASYDSYAADYCAELMGDPSRSEKQRLYRGVEGGGFQEVTAACRLDRISAPMGANFGDLDNDGFLDFCCGTGRPGSEELPSNVMFHNHQGKQFAEISISGGFGSLQKGHGVVFADFDSDGDQDVFEQMGGAFVGDKYFNALYENPGFGNHFVVLHLVGTKSNRSAVGARIRADITENGAQRSIYRHVNSGGSFGGNPLRQSIGLGSAQHIDLLEIYWPTSGRTQRFENVPCDQTLQIVEPAS